MKNSIIFVLFATMQISLFGCSPDEQQETTPPVVVTPPGEMPTTNLLKPAIRNIGDKKSASKTNGRIAGTNEVRKLMIKSTQFANNRFNTNYKYKLSTLSDAEYRLLPNDNLFDPAEISLNESTEVEYFKTYSYNDLQQMTTEATTYVLNPSVSEPTKTYSYDVSGKLNQIFVTQYSTYTYNAEGLISAKLRKSDNAIEFTYEYDNQGRILNVYHYYDDPSGRKIDMHYVYSYPDVNFYTKTWYSVNSLTGDETRVDKLIYQYDPTKPGIFNKEPIYQLENQFLHIMKITQEPNTGTGWSVFPKYFYDSEGYLMKYDGSGLNRTVDIIVFKYE